MEDLANKAGKRLYIGAIPFGSITAEKNATKAYGVHEDTKMTIKVIMKHK